MEILVPYFLYRCGNTECLETLTFSSINLQVLGRGGIALPQIDHSCKRCQHPFFVFMKGTTKVWKSTETIDS